jgi:hypothetical protein
MAVASALALAAPAARADVVTDWNAAACNIATESKLPTPPAARALTIAQAAVYEAVNAITKKYPVHDLQLESPKGASVDAAVAAANHVTLGKLFAGQQAAVESVYTAALAKIPDGPDRVAGIKVGEAAANGVLAARAQDTAGMAESYRPTTPPGIYVPTTIPLASGWMKRPPWLMKSASQFRPGPPPSLTSDVYTRDYNEIKAIGSKQSATRTPEQTEIARFWEATGPAIYHGLIRSVATAPNREVTKNALLLAACTQAADDALIAVFDAKYHYNFWRPITAIRNGDRDRNNATDRDSTWVPFIDTPMHPEYPCAHCILSGAVGTVIEADVAGGPAPTLTAQSPTANGASRSWTSVEAFMKEVADGRIYDGVHYRNSTEVGNAMGRQVGALAVAKYYGGEPAKAPAKGGAKGGAKK